MRMSAMSTKKLQRGVAAVEFGILIIPLALMLFGLAEYGRAIYQYNTLAKSVRDATRYLSSLAPGELNAVGENEWNKARCIARYGNTSCSGSAPLVPNLTKDMVEICDASNWTNCATTHALVDTFGAVNMVTVKISNYEFSSLINFPLGGLNIGASNIKFGDISNTMRQAVP